MVSSAEAWTALERGGQTYLICRPLAGLPWLVHGFSRRSDSEGRPNNLGLHVGDEAEAVLARRRLFLRGLGLRLDDLVAGVQVHGTKVAVVGPEKAGAGALTHATALPATDGLATYTAGLVLSVYHADCAPILLADPASKAVAAVHAGWRGAVAGIAAEAVQVMKNAFAAEPGRILAAIGPSIGTCCFKIGPEVAAAVPAAARESVLRHEGGEARLDLGGLNAWWLREAGLAEANVFVPPACTSCRNDLYFSHRREGERAGRMMAVIARRF